MKMILGRAQRALLLAGRAQRDPAEEFGARGPVKDLGAGAP